MPAMQLTIRDARSEDASALLTIYNDAVLNTTSVWTEEPRTLDAQKLWMEEKRATAKPVLVADEGGTVVGFSTYGPFRAWPGYRYTVENSIYVASSHRGRGIGSLLLAPLVERARATGRPVSVGLGPRYLHSTGQLHKGGPSTGLFVQVVDDLGEELPIPGKPFGFRALIAAQAAGDFEALKERGRRIVRVRL